ncbi:hypothetical protein IJJ12_01680 [bacterium]|nr:hypothetical protein [bacterium]
MAKKKTTTRTQTKKTTRAAATKVTKSAATRSRTRAAASQKTVATRTTPPKKTRPTAKKAAAPTRSHVTGPAKRRLNKTMLAMGFIVLAVGVAGLTWLVTNFVRTQVAQIEPPVATDDSLITTGEPAPLVINMETVPINLATTDASLTPISGLQQLAQNLVAATSNGLTIEHIGPLTERSGVYEFTIKFTDLNDIFTAYLTPDGQLFFPNNVYTTAELLGNRHEGVPDQAMLHALTNLLGGGMQVESVSQPVQESGVLSFTVKFANTDTVFTSYITTDGQLLFVDGYRSQALLGATQ